MLKTMVSQGVNCVGTNLFIHQVVVLMTFVVVKQKFA